MRHFCLSISALLFAFLLTLPCYAQRPKMVIADLVLEDSLNTREKQLLNETDITQMLREALTDSRSFTIVSRDDASVAAITREKDLENSELAREKGAQKQGLDVASYFLQPTVKTFNYTTRYEAMELLDDMFERRDSVEIDIAIRVFDAGGNTLFEERVKTSKHFGPTEASTADKRRNVPKYSSQVRGALTTLCGDVSDALVERINPIVVIDVEGSAIILDRGKNSGFDENTRLAIYSKAKEVEHPTTGEIRRIPGARIGEAKVVTIHEDITELQLMDGDASRVVPGSIVKFIKD